MLRFRGDGRGALRHRLGWWQAQNNYKWQRENLSGNSNPVPLQIIHTFTNRRQSFMEVTTETTFHGKDKFTAVVNETTVFPV